MGTLPALWLLQHWPLGRKIDVLGLWVGRLAPLGSSYSRARESYLGESYSGELFPAASLLPSAQPRACPDPFISPMLQLVPKGSWGSYLGPRVPLVDEKSWG